MSNNELEVYYQPFVSTQDESIVAFEALIRWHHPKMGLINPETLIYIAEKTGLIIQLSEWVLKTACEQNKKWQDMSRIKYNISINISASQFQDKNLVQNISSIINNSGLEPCFVILEITESIAMKDIRRVISKLKQLKLRGLKIAIDDFGAGYSSLSYISRLPIDHIKIDKNFISEIAQNPKVEAIIRQIVVLAKELDLKVIAEGCETAEQKDFLCAVNCDYIQGYYFYKPLKASDVEDLLL